MTGPATATLGENLTYTILVTNKGELDATGIKLVDALPAGVTLVSVTPSQGTCTGKFNCSLGSLARNGTATITAVIVAPAVSDFSLKSRSVPTRRILASPTILLRQIRRLSFQI